MNIKSAFPSRFLKAADLQGRRVIGTIDRVMMEDIGDDGQKPVVYFENKEKGLVLNVTNANMIEEIAKTPETDEWQGVQIVMYPTKVDFSGRRVDAIRVDYPSNGRPKPPPPPDDTGDDIPF